MCVSSRPTGDLFALEKLSDYPAAFTEVDSRGWYPLHRAAVQQSVQVLEMVIYGEIEVNGCSLQVFLIFSQSAMLHFYLFLAFKEWSDNWHQITFFVFMEYSGLPENYNCYQLLIRMLFQTYMPLKKSRESNANEDIHF